MAERYSKITISILGRLEHGYGQLSLPDGKLAGLSHDVLLFGKEKVKMSTMVSTGRELKSKPSYGKGRYVTSIPLLVLVHDVLL